MSHLKTKICSFINAGLDKLKTPEMKISIQDAFTNHGLFGMICSPEQKRIALAALEAERDQVPVQNLGFATIEQLELQAAPENDDLNEAITLTFDALGAQLAELDYHEDYHASDSESSQDYQDDHDAGSDSE